MTPNAQMYELNLEKAEEPEIKWPTPPRSQKKQCKTENPFYFTSSLPPSLFCLLTVVPHCFSLGFYKRTWHPDPDRMVILRRQSAISLVSWLVSTLSLGFTALLCGKQNEHGLGSTASNFFSLQAYLVLLKVCGSLALADDGQLFQQQNLLKSRYVHSFLQV